MLRRMIFVILGLTAGALLSQGLSYAADLQQCESKTVDTQQRLTACNRVERDTSSSKREHARALFQIGRLVLWTPGGIDAAKAAWEKAIVADQSFAPPIIARAEWFILGNQGHEAIKLLQPVLAANPHDIDALVMIGRAYANATVYDEAMDSFGKALILDPQNVNALFQSARVMEMAGDFAHAAEFYEKAGEKYDPSATPESGIGIENPYLAAARNHERLGEFAKALPLVTRVIKEDRRAANDSPVFERRASYYEALGFNGNAIEDLTSALRYAQPNELASLLFKRGVVYQKVGKEEDAATDFRKALGSGDRRTILRMQVYLRNQGFNEVKINGTSSPDLMKSIAACVATAKCGAGLGKPI
jgi:Flp pilus assembly protein TadD